MERAVRVLIVGARDFRRSDELVEIECFSWGQVKNIANPSDYDRIILNLTSLIDRTAFDWDSFFQKFTAEMTLEVLINSGQIVIIGDPRFSRRTDDGRFQLFLSWTGFRFDWDNRPGRTKKCDANDGWTKHFSSYIEKISRWDYSLRDYEPPKLRREDVAKILASSETQFSSKFKLQPFCENRYGGFVAFVINLTIRTSTDILEGESLRSKRQGLIFFLPGINMPDEEVVAMVLWLLGISVVIPEPPWASSIIAPGQKEIDQRIEELKDEIAQLEEDLKRSQKEREDLRRCVHLLYKMGDELEEAVREILGSIGSEVEPPTEKGKEDGWLTVKVDGEIFEGVIEIKGTKRNQFSLDGPRQLMDWKSRGKLKRKKKYKGIFVGNSAVERNVSEREFPFAEDWTDTAKLDEQVALECRHLYELYRLDCEGKLDRNEFWRSLFQTNGIFDPAPLRQIEK